LPVRVPVCNHSPLQEAWQTLLPSGAFSKVPQSCSLASPRYVQSANANSLLNNNTCANWYHVPNAAFDSESLPRNAGAASLSSVRGGRPSAARYIRSIRSAVDFVLRTSGRLASAFACSVTNGLFIKNNACCGTVVW